MNLDQRDGARCAACGVSSGAVFLLLWSLLLVPSVVGAASLNVDVLSDAAHLLLGRGIHRVQFVLPLRDGGTWWCATGVGFDMRYYRDSLTALHVDAQGRAVDRVSIPIEAIGSSYVGQFMPLGCDTAGNLLFLVDVGKMESYFVFAKLGHGHLSWAQLEQQAEPVSQFPTALSAVDPNGTLHTVRGSCYSQLDVNGTTVRKVRSLDASAAMTESGPLGRQRRAAALMPEPDNRLILLSGWPYYDTLQRLPSLYLYDDRSFTLLDSSPTLTRRQAARVWPGFRGTTKLVKTPDGSYWLYTPDFADPNTMLGLHIASDLKVIASPQTDTLVPEEASRLPLAGAIVVSSRTSMGNSYGLAGAHGSTPNRLSLQVDAYTDDGRIVRAHREVTWFDQAPEQGR